MKFGSEGIGSCDVSLERGLGVLDLRPGVVFEVCTLVISSTIEPTEALSNLIFVLSLPAGKWDGNPYLLSHVGDLLRCGVSFPQESGGRRPALGELSAVLKDLDQHLCFDSNCLFRALGDQLEGHSRNHLKHRQETVDYMIRQREDFEPFVEDDIPFEKHGRFTETLGPSGATSTPPPLPGFANVNYAIHLLSKLVCIFCE